MSCVFFCLHFSIVSGTEEKEYWEKQFQERTRNSRGGKGSRRGGRRGGRGGGRGGGYQGYGGDRKRRNMEDGPAAKKQRKDGGDIGGGKEKVKVEDGAKNLEKPNETAEAAAMSMEC